MSEQTYRNPLFGSRVDRYIPPELRQGLGALLSGADMLNPVSAYRDYLKDVREGDVVGAVTNAAGFVAPGVASAFASRLARPAASAVAPYADDAARVLMDVLTPTGAPDIQAAVRNSPRGMSRRAFLAGLGAAAATPALPVDEILEGLGRAGGRVRAGNLVDELVGILDRRRELMNEYAQEFSRRRSEVGLGDEGIRRELMANLEKRFEPMFDELESDFFKKISTSNIAQGDLEGLSDEVLQELYDTALRSSLVDGYSGPELAERIREFLASRRPQSEVSSMLPDVTSRMVGGGDLGRGLGDVSSGSGRASFEDIDGGLGSVSAPPRVEDFGFRRDNPGGDWLARKQRDADLKMSESGRGLGRRGITGSVTGTVGMDRDMFLPTDVLSRLTGLMDERRVAGDPKFDDLLSRVREEGFDPDQSGNRVVIAVNHRGEPYILEGNTRVAVARELGLPSVKAEVRYWNGGEDVSGPFAPDRVMSLGSSVPSARSSGGDSGVERGLGSFDFPSPEVSQRTQISGTLPTYMKALEVFEEVAPAGDSLDYGAGLGKSSELGFDTFEPYAREGFDPTYRSSSDIPDESYDRVTNLNVLNVLAPDVRRGVVLDIGRVLRPDGVAIITTRGRDVLSANGRTGPEDMSIVTSSGTYQKGFTRAELVDYLRGTLGDGFVVNPLRLGPAGAIVRKLPRRSD